MRKIHQLKEINDYLSAVKVPVESTVPDLLILDYGKTDLSNASWPDAYRTLYFEINLDLTAGCDINIDSFSLPSAENRLTMISPFRLQTAGDSAVHAGESHKGYSILFSQEFIGANAAHAGFLRDFPFFSTLNSPIVPVRKEELSSFVDIISKIQDEYKDYGAYSKEIIRNYLNILFLKAKKNYTVDTPKVMGREQEIYQTFEKMVQQHFQELNTVKAYAGRLHVSSKHLSETVKKISGQSALQVIHNVQLGYARTQLAQTDKTVAQIAGELNFENPDYFSVFFKRLTGKSPLQYRAS